MTARTGDEAHEHSPAHTDSSGLPWAGRRMDLSAFAGDTGAPDPDLLALLAAPSPLAADQEALLMALLARSRVLVPIVPAPAPPDGQHGDPPNGGRARGLAAVTLTGPAGQRALPVFTGLPALAAWDAAARPAPVTVRDAALGATSQDCDILVLDAGSPHATVLRRSMLSALASGRTWVPAYRDPVVVQALAAALASEPAAVGYELGPADPGSDVVVLTVRLRPGLAAEQVRSLTRRVGERLAAGTDLRTRFDELVLRIEAAEEE